MFFAQKIAPKMQVSNFVLHNEDRDNKPSTQQPFQLIQLRHSIIPGTSPNLKAGENQWKLL